MMRSMFSGVSGLKGHQTRMDVVGNNIANVNTTGFKASRVTFADMISQNISGAAAPNGTIGGVNPKQVGLGMAVASTDLIYTNGSVQQTGKNTDVAISRGDGLFVVSKGEQKYYTRNGAFEFDAEGNLTIPSSGLYVQGYMADNGRVAMAGDNTTNIKIPAGKPMAGTETDLATYTKNLNATTQGYEVANALIKYADGTTETAASYNPTEKGIISLTMESGERITLDEHAGYNFSTATMGIGQVFYKSKISTVTAVPTGKVDLTLALGGGNSPKKISGGTANVVRSGLKSGTYAINGEFVLTGKIKIANAISTDEVELTLEKGNSLDPDNEVTITVPKPTTFTYAPGDVYNGTLLVKQIAAQPNAVVTTVDGNRAKLSAALSVTSPSQEYERKWTADDGKLMAVTREVTYENNGKIVNSVTLNTKSGTSIAGLVAKSYTKGDTFYPSVTTTVTVYDSLGASHSVPVVFTKSENNKWIISLGSGGNAYSIREADGTTTTVSLTKTDLTFDSSGAYTDGTASLTLTYQNGAAPKTVSMNLSAITQYSGTSTISATSNGNAAGTLASVSIDSRGVITGTYTNNVRRVEAQIAMAQFNNPSGLTKMGGNLYQESNNSGTRTISGAADIGSELTTSALEMSNVDIADQFSDMIITQRGFQSNSKIITVSDEMLETLINMKR